VSEQSFWKRYGSVLLYWIVFIGILGLAIFINERYPKFVEVHFSKWTASTSGLLMRILGMGGEVDGIHITNRYCRFHIIGECTAYYPLAIFLGATLAFPVRWWRKLLGIVLGIPLLLIVNQARLITLCYIYRWYPDLFDAIHALVWQAMMIFFTVIVWILWVTTLGQEHASKRT
jgi:archaeosortase B (VPXXXP-CTERM-specific)